MAKMGTRGRLQSSDSPFQIVLRCRLGGATHLDASIECLAMSVHAFQCVESLKDGYPTGLWWYVGHLDRDKPAHRKLLNSEVEWTRAMARKLGRVCVAGMRLGFNRRESRHVQVTFVRSEHAIRPRTTEHSIV